MTTSPLSYRFEIDCLLPLTWSDNFNGLTINHEGSKTVLYGVIVDQAALHGVLMRIRDMGLPLLLVKRIEKDRC